MRKASCLLLCLLMALGAVPFGPKRASADAPGPIFPQIVAGYYHTMGLLSDGSIWAWGGNEHGAMGNGTTGYQNTPVAASGLTGVKKIAAGERNSYAIKNDGTVWAWGHNVNGQLGDGTTIDRTLPVEVSGISDVIDLSGGIGYHALALKSDGTVWAWGKNDSGELGDGTTVQKNVPVQVEGLAGMIAVSAGGYHSLALKSDGTVWAWGYNIDGEVGNGTTSAAVTVPVQVSGLTDIVAISAGNYHNLALKSDGTVWAWGPNAFGQLGDGTSTARKTPVQVADLGGVTQISAGGTHSLALKSDGTVWGWGLNNYHQLGDGTTTNRYQPEQLTGLSGIAAVAAGAFHSSAMTRDGLVWGWGYNDYGQLGTGDWTDAETPILSKAVLDDTPPTPGDGGVTASDVTTDSLTLNWTKATDNLTPTSELRYSVYMSDMDDIGSVKYAESRGFKLIGDATDLDQLEVGGWSTGQTYYFTVVVKDNAGSKSAYPMKDVTLKALVSVHYDGNGSTEGMVPSDPNVYEQDSPIPVQGKGDLAKPGFTFTGWNTALDGSGSSYAEGDSLPAGTADVYLYAQWEEDAPPSTDPPVDPPTDPPTNPPTDPPTDPVTYSVTYDGNGNDSGSAPMDAGAYGNGDPVTVQGSGDLAKPGYAFAGWNTAKDGSGTGYAAGDTFAMGEANVSLYAQWQENPPPPPPPPIVLAPPADPGITILVGDRPRENAATVTKSTQNGSQTVTVTLDPTELDDWIAASDEGAVITVPAAEPEAERTAVSLSGSTAKALEAKRGAIELQTGYGSYTLTAEQLNLDRLLAAFGDGVRAEDIKIRIEIGKNGEAEAKLAESAEASGAFELVVPPVTFEISAVYDGNTVPVDRFDSFVTREIPLPEGVDPDRIATAVVLNGDGTFRPVPTAFAERGGQSFAVIRSLTNSVYALVSHAKTFEDVTGRWSQQAVEDLASRWIVGGTDERHFDPDREVTRAEFAAMAARAFGLPDESAEGTNRFSDVSASDWFAGAVTQASAYDLVRGTEDGAFGPFGPVSREEAAAILMRARKLAGDEAAVGGDGEEAETALAAFSDGSSVSGWAKPDMAQAAKLGVVQGSDGKLRPSARLTRAEAAAMIERMLRQLHLI